MMTFDQLIETANDRKGASVCLILAWVLTIDCYVVNELETKLRTIFEPARLSDHVDDLIAIFKNDDVSDILMACSILKDSFNKKEAGYFIELCLAMILVDKRLVVIENHAFRFLLDYFSVSIDVVNRLHRLFEGVNYPDVKNLDTRSGWRHYRFMHGRKKSPILLEKASTEILVPKYLGLTFSYTSEDEVQDAYRQLITTYPLERYQSLGAEALEVAKLIHQQIQTAMEMP
ncbi:hypothetical protein P4C99_20785 [Pontiellaceae bacterium B1224]|nr:hypothetical protein [Pontiellaceae bacterium B1224]